MHGSAQTLKKALIHTYSDNPVKVWENIHNIPIKAKYDIAKDKENYNENTKAQNLI